MFEAPEHPFKISVNLNHVGRGSSKICVRIGSGVTLTPGVSRVIFDSREEFGCIVSMQM